MKRFDVLECFEECLSQVQNKQPQLEKKQSLKHKIYKPVNKRKIIIKIKNSFKS